MGLSINKVLCCGFNFPHHSHSSGYHHIVPLISDEYLNANRYLFGNSEFGSFKRKINLLIYDILIPFKYKEHQLIHYIYPENHLLVSVSKKRVNVATVHLPVEWLEKNSKRSFIGELRYHAFLKLDGIITLSQDQADLLKEYLPNSNIKFIPHGINELTSKPLKIPKDNFKIVVIGSNFRDYNIIYNLLKFIESESKNWEIHMLGLEKSRISEFKDNKNVKVYKYLEEDQYISIIENSHVHLLPVTFATANNALLEAHALGVPTVATNLQAIKDYALSTTRLFDSEQELINELLDVERMDTDQYNILRVNTHNESKRFYWSNIKKEVMDFYEEVKMNK
ncbi:glycosyltransferase family 4 protein [Niallia sp. 03133]|uniref:glycosyltransferase family 4 protein n=1 Tax=Niallia sp. 03133 TaxID=3458060 RepID=UPI004043DE68